MLLNAVGGYRGRPNPGESRFTFLADPAARNDAMKQTRQNVAMTTWNRRHYALPLHVTMEACVMPIRGDSIRACAELLHQAGSVPDLPVVHTLAVFEALDRDTTERDALAGWRDAE